MAKELRGMYIFAGTRYNGKSRLFRYYHITDSTIKLKEPLDFSTRLKCTGSVGSVIEADRDHNTFSNHSFCSYNVKETHPATAEITQWSIFDRAAKATVEMATQAKKEHSKSLDSLVEDIKRCMFRLSPRERANVALYIYRKLV